MDVHPLTVKIEENARNMAESLLSEARARITDLQEATDEDLQQMQQDAERQASEEGDRLEQNLRRLAALDSRKQLLERKHALIDEGFDAALQALHEQPTEKLRALFLQQVLQYAQGTEQVTAGAISDAFYDEAFLREANDALKQAGRPGELTDSGQRRPGVSGLVLTRPGSESLLTVETMLQQSRDALQGEVADLLCGGLS